MDKTPWLLTAARIFGVIVFILMLIMTFYPALSVKAQTPDGQAENQTIIPEEATVEELLIQVLALQQKQLENDEETQTLLSKVKTTFDVYVSNQGETAAWNIAILSFQVGLLVVIIFAVTWGG